MNEAQFLSKYEQLLRDLKTTVEGLLVSQVPNVWCIYGGLNRLHVDIEKIFKHGCKHSCENNISGYWHFIQGLEWLHPDSSKSTLTIDCEYKPYVPQHLKNDKASVWLYRCLENHSLSQKLSWLISDKMHLLACYQSKAFLCQEKYAEATLICLRAVERNSPGLISEIDPSLFLNKPSLHNYYKVHRRSSSFPNTYIKMTRRDTKKIRYCYDEGAKCNNTVSSDNTMNCNHQIMHKTLRVWKSMPNLTCISHLTRQIKSVTSFTNPSTPVHNKRKISITDQFMFPQCVLESKQSDQTNQLVRQQASNIIINTQEEVEHSMPSTSSNQRTAYKYEVLTQSFPNTKLPNKRKTLGISAPDYGFPDYGFLSALSGEKDFKNKPKKTFIEDGGASVLPMATGYFPRPVQGQTLISFLTSSQFTRTNAELDRENAHFNMSEAIIAAIEQIRCKHDHTLSPEQEEINESAKQLTQRIRLRRKEKLVENQKKLWDGKLLDSNRIDNTATSSYSSSPESCIQSITSEDIDDIDIDDASNLPENSALSMSMASLYSESDVFKQPRGVPDGASDILSAESVALSLISKFNEKQLPRASDLEWLVSEEDTAQALLPLPKSWPINPDDLDVSVTPLRGTQEWAPPRPQIIFTLHMPPSRKVLMAKQNYRCAGCGMRVTAKYASKYRYCHYLGRYFCTGCHTNQVSLIPARIIQKWDFSRYPVSMFSYRLLEQMYTDPLFKIFELNGNISKRTRNLVVCHKYRVGLYYMKDFIMSCRFAETIQEYLRNETFLNEPDNYSLEDLENVRNGEMKSRLKYFIEMCCRHIYECELCLARGFICEICHSSDVIFPWHQGKVSRCAKCGSCFHSTCWTDTKSCVRCKRIDKRKLCD